MATPQQIEANRSNAQKSTGATSQPGKERSSLNWSFYIFNRICFSLGMSWGEVVFG